VREEKPKKAVGGTAIGKKTNRYKTLWKRTHHPQMRVTAPQRGELFRAGTGRANWGTKKLGRIFIV